MPKGVPNKRYTPEFKKLVVETMQKEKLSCRETARQFEINNHKCVGAWEPIRPWIFQPDRRRSGHPGSGGRRRSDPPTAIRIGSAVSPAPAAIFPIAFPWRRSPTAPGWEEQSPENTAETASFWTRWPGAMFSLWSLPRTGPGGSGRWQQRGPCSSGPVYCSFSSGKAEEKSRESGKILKSVLFSKRKVPQTRCLRDFFWCRWRGSNPHGC